MLFKVTDLQSINASGTSLAFRKWKNPTVKKGTLLKTAVSQNEMLTISHIRRLKGVTNEIIIERLPHD